MRGQRRGVCGEHRGLARVASVCAERDLGSSAARPVSAGSAALVTGQPWSTALRPEFALGGESPGTAPWETHQTFCPYVKIGRVLEFPSYIRI